jgi:hypothetical protein
VAALDHHLNHQEETLTDTIPQPPPDGITPEIRAWMVAACRAADAGDSLSWLLECRVVALEEVAAARWPRRLLLAWRLGRQLRVSVAPFRWEHGFLWQRTEAVTNAWLAEYAQLHRRRATRRDDEADSPDLPS